MASTLQNILQNVGAIVDQDTTLPTGTDLLVRVNLANQALNEWGVTYQWESLRVANFTPTFVLSATSLAMPANFEKLASRVWDKKVTPPDEYIEIRPDDRYKKETDDKYVYVGGDAGKGKYLFINPALPSGASLVFDYMSSPSAMATLADVCVCPSSLFIEKWIIGKIFESRADTRFPQFISEAQNILDHMYDDEVALGFSRENKMRDSYRASGFRIGE